MTTITSFYGLHGNLAPLRDWDYPDDVEKFWASLPRKAAAPLGRTGRLGMNRRVHARNGGTTVYEVTLLSASGQTPLATCYVGVTESAP